MAAIDSYMEPPNRLAEDGGYKGKTILITGATGFLGKLLVEKMLRTCPLVTKIYIIARRKKEKDPQERLKELFEGPIFDLLKQTRGEAITNKVTVIEGEISEIGLGLSPNHRKILVTEVEIIFHLAATVRFDEPFKKAVLINVRGTKSLLDLAKECNKLLAFAHVSTAFSQPHEKVLYEKTYPPPADPNDIIKIVEGFDDKLIARMAPALKGTSPNTYAYTKALGEGLVNNEMDNLPVIILRPSIVLPIWKEPIPGWTNNMNGPTGMLVAGGKGILRTMHGNPNGYADFVPADIVINAIMLCTFHFINNKEFRVANITSSSLIKISWQDVKNIGKRISDTTMPLNWVIWYPGGSMRTSKWVHNVCVVLFHYIPAIILDCLIILTGNKPVLWKIQQRITEGSKLFEFYTINQWEFDNQQLLEIRDTFNETEKHIYKVDEKGLDIDEYFYTCTHAARLYLLKESDESIPTAQRHMKIMWAVDQTCKFLMLMGLAIGFTYFVLKY